METINEWLGLAASLLQIGSFVFALFTFWVLWRARRQLKQELLRLRRENTARPMALAIGLGGDIQGTVRQFLDSNGLQMIQITPYSWDGVIPEDRYHDVLRTLLKIKQNLTDRGITELYLFYKGPVTLAMGIGAIFDNWVPIKLYGYHGGTYRLEMILEKETVLGLLQEVTHIGEDAVAEALVERLP